MAIPEEGGCKTTREMVIAWYRLYLERDPENEGAIIGRVGLPCEEVRLGIANSQEAENVRERKGGSTGGGTTTPPPIVTPPTPPPGSSLIPGFDWLVQQIQNLAGAVNAKAREAAADVQRVAGEIQQAVREKVDAASKAVGASLTQLGTALNDLTKDLIPNTIALIGTALGGIETLVAAVMSNAADIGDIGDLVVGLFSDNKIPMGNFLFDLIAPDEGGIAGAVGAKIVTAIFPQASILNDVAEIMSGMLPQPREVDV